MGSASSGVHLGNMLQCLNTILLRFQSIPGLLIQCSRHHSDHCQWRPSLLVTCDSDYPCPKSRCPMLLGIGHSSSIIRLDGPKLWLNFPANTDVLYLGFVLYTLLPPNVVARSGICFASNQDNLKMSLYRQVSICYLTSLEIRALVRLLRRLEAAVYGLIKVSKSRRVT
jgi:hypothetical protein